MEREVFRKKGTTFERFEVSKGGDTHLVSVRSTVQQDAFVLKRRVVSSLHRRDWSSRCEADGNTSRMNELRISVSSQVRVTTFSTCFFFFFTISRIFVIFFFCFVLNINDIVYLFIYMYIRFCRGRH